MAEDRSGLILHLLREIRAKQDGHSAKFAEQDGRFDSLEKKIEEWQETTATGVGLATHASLRTQHIEEEIADPKRRIERLEQAH